MQKLLVIDDEEGIRIAIQEVLERDSLKVCAAQDSESGLRDARGAARPGAAGY